MIEDYRYDPFSGAHDGSSVTDERYWIPQNTPRHVLLNEVPMQELPTSSVSVKCVDKLAEDLDNSETDIDVDHGTWWVAGDVLKVDDEEILIGDVSSNILTGCTRGYNSTTPATHDNNADAVNLTEWTEVGVDPTSTRTFRVDYSRGYITFASADNSKEIFVSYKPIGSPVSAYQGAIEEIIFGDGSEGDLFVPSGTTVELQGKPLYRNIYIESGGYIKPPSSNYNWQLELCVSGKLTIGGTVSTVGFGALGGQTAEADGAGGEMLGGAGGGGGGGVNAGNGGDTIISNHPVITTGGGGTGGTTGGNASARSAYTRLSPYISLSGAGGGATAILNGTDGRGGNGGGGLIINANEIEILSSGEIDLSGADGTINTVNLCGSGGGGSGSLLVRYRRYTNNGTITLDGGLGGNASGGNDGGNGADGVAEYIKIQ